MRFDTMVLVAGTPGRVCTTPGAEVLLPWDTEMMAGNFVTGTFSKLPLVGLIIVVVTTVVGALDPGAVGTLIGPPETTLGIPPCTVMFPGGRGTPWLI